MELWLCGCVSIPSRSLNSIGHHSIVGNDVQPPAGATIGGDESLEPHVSLSTKAQNAPRQIPQRKNEQTTDIQLYSLGHSFFQGRWQNIVVNYLL